MLALYSDKLSWHWIDCRPSVMGGIMTCTYERDVPTCWLGQRRSTTVVEDANGQRRVTSGSVLTGSTTSTCPKEVHKIVTQLTDYTGDSKHNNERAIYRNHK